jgi:signal transduction histidine kinase
LILFDRSSSAFKAGFFSGLWVLILSSAVGLYAIDWFSSHAGTHLDLHVQQDLAILSSAIAADHSLEGLEVERAVKERFSSENAGFGVFEGPTLLAGSLPPAKKHWATAGLNKQKLPAFRVQKEEIKSEGRQLTLIVWHSLDADVIEVRNFRFAILTGILLCGLAGAIGVALIVARQFDPVHTLNNQIASNTDALSLKPVDVPVGAYEISKLAVSYNQVLGTLQQQVGEIEQFAERCAHELRTPLAIMRLSVEREFNSAAASSATAVSGIQDQHIKPDERSRNLETQLETLDRLSVLVNRLLTLARGAEATQLEPVSLNELLDAALDEIGPLFEESSWTIHRDLRNDFNMVCHRASLHQVLIDLFDNCLRHNPPGGELYLSSLKVGRMVQLMIKNVNPMRSTENAAIQSSPTYSLGRSYRLGQPIARRLMREMSGSIEWMKEPNSMLVVLQVPKA